MELKSSIIECTNPGCSWEGKSDHFKVRLLSDFELISLL